MERNDTYMEKRIAANEVLQKRESRDSYYRLNLEKILAAYNALRDYRNAPSNNDSKELNYLWELKQDLNFDELTVFYELVQIAYLDGRIDGLNAY